MTPQPAFVLGEHNAAIAQLLRDQRQMKADIAQIRDLLAQRKGERRVAMWVMSTASGVLGALLVLLTKFVLGSYPMPHS